MSAVTFTGPQPVTLDPNVQTIQSNATITSSGSVTTIPVLGTALVELIINITAAPTGTSPTLQFSIVEVDPVDGLTPVGTPTTSNVFNAAGYQIVELTSTKSSAFQVSWTIGGTSTPTFTGVNVSVSGKSGSSGGSSSNASVGLVSTTAPGSATQIGGVDTTTGLLVPVTVGTDGHVGIAGNSLLGFAGEVIGWTTSTHQAPAVDAVGALYTRGQVMTDEGSFIDDFPGSGFTTNLTGTLSFTNNSDQVVGTGTKFQSELDYYTVIKKSTDADTLYIQVTSVEDDTHLTLLTPYQGTTQSGQTGVKSKWITTVGTGASLSVGSSLVTIAAGTTSGSITGFWTVPDYIPFLGAFKVSVDNRRANQLIYIGWFDVAKNSQPNLVAAFLLDGVTNTTVKCVSGTSSAAADTQTTSITIPNAANSSASNVYRVAPWQGQVAFYINDTLVAVNTQHIVPPYADLRFGVYVVNTGVPAGATGIVTDSAIYESIDRFDVRAYNTNADLFQTTANGRTTTGVPVPIQVSAAGIVTVSGAVTATNATAANFKISGSTTPVNALATTAIGIPTVDFLMGYNGTTWDMVRAGSNSNDAVSTIATGILATSSYLMGFNGTTWDRLRSTTANGLAVDITRVQGTVTVGGINAAGGGITGNPVRIGGSDGTNTRDIQTDTAGNIEIVGTGTAGTPAGGVLTVQGVASMTALKVDGSGVTQPVSGTFWQATQPVSAASLPLPTGAATETTLGTRLADATFTTRIPVNGQALMAASVPVVIASNQSAVPVTGTFWQATQPVSAASLPLPTGAATEATLGGVLTTTAFQARTPVLGQAAMAASSPVVIASDQSPIPISGTVSATPAVNVVDANNSTTTPLGSNAVFTGASTDLIGCTAISYSFYSDVSGATLGFEVQFSPDNVNWDSRVRNTYTYDGTVTDLTIRPHDRYYRIKYTNGGSAQTVMRLQSILWKQPATMADSIGVDHPPTSGDDAMLVKAVIAGKSTAGGGSYVDVKVNPSGTIQIGGGDTPADGHANPTDAQLSTAFNMGWNGASWDRIHTHGTDIDGDASISTGALEVASHNMMYNGTSWDRIRGTLANGQAVDVTRVQGTVAVTGTFWQSTQPVSAVSLPLPTGAATETTLSTRLADATFTARINTLGQKTMANSTPVVLASDQASIPVTFSGTVDVSDRAARLLGVVYGSQAQQIKQTATNFNLATELFTGGTAYDARQIRALTSSDVVTAAQGTAAAANAPWATRLSDGTSFYNTSTAAQLPAALVGGRLDANTGSWLGSTAPTVGSKTSANSIPVVIASDQGAVTAGLPDVTVSGVFNSAVSNLVVALGGRMGVSATVATGSTGNGGVTVNFSTDGGVTYYYANYSWGPPPSYGAGSDFFLQNVGTTLIFPPPGTTHVKLISSGWSSGSSTITMTATASGSPLALLRSEGALNASIPSIAMSVGGQGANGGTSMQPITVKATTVATAAADTSLVVGLHPTNNKVQGAGAAGAAVSGNPVRVGGSDGANTQNLYVSSTGGIRLDNWLGSTAPTVGSKTSANSIPVVIASDQGAVAVTAAQATAANLNATVVQGNAGTAAQGWFVRVADASGNLMPIGDTVARSSYGRITDGTNTAAVKAASTAAVATDPALVVAISPNNPLSLALTDTTATGALGALNAAVSVAMQGQGSASLTLAAGTLVGTIVPEVSFDGGTSWWTGDFVDPSTGVIATSVVFGSSNTLTAKSIIVTGGVTNVRVRVSAYTSGTANATVKGVASTAPTTTLYGGVPGQVVPPGGVTIGGSDGTNFRFIRTDTSGYLSARITDGTNFMPTMDAAARRGYQSLTDGTSVAAVKAASTAAVATDPALVVAVSPNNSVAVTQATAANLKAQVVGISLAMADAASNTQLVVQDQSFLMGWNNASWDRVRSGTTAGDAVATQTTGALYTQAYNLGWNGTTWDRIRSGGTAADAVATQTTGTLYANAFGYAFNGTTWDRLTMKAASTAAVAADKSLVVALSPNTPAKIWDGTNTAAVKAASTAAIATDPALVVSLSPNNPVQMPVDVLPATANITARDIASTSTAGANGQVYVTGSATANSSVGWFTTNGYSSYIIQVTGTWTGTLQAEVSFDSGTTWFARPLQQIGVDNFYTTFTSNFTGVLGALGANQIRVRSVGGAWTGTATAKLVDSFNPTVVSNQTASRITDSAGNGPAAVKAASTAAVAADPALVVALSPNIGTTGRLPVQMGGPGTTESFGSLVVSKRSVSVSVPFFQATPTALATNPGAVITISGTGTTAQSLGRGQFNTGAGATNQIKVTTNISGTYNGHSELFAAFTAAFTNGGVATSYQRIGPMDAAATPVNGFAFGYNATTFGLWTIYNSTATFVAQSSWNIDVLSGAAGSKFTLNGSPVALTQTNINLYRIRYGWLGIAPVIFEVLSPDGEWVVVHQTRSPGQQQTVTVTTPNLPITLDVAKTAGATDIRVYCGCWVAGTTESNEAHPDSALQYNVSQSASAVTMMPANTTRKKYAVFNDTTATMYVSHSSTASTTNFKYKVAPGQGWTDDFPCFTGSASVIWSGAGAGAVRVTEEF